MKSFLVFSLVLMLWAARTSSQSLPSSCDSCGKECESACGTRGFRICCLNYLKKRSTPVAAEPETVMMVLPQIPRYNPALRFLVPDTSDRKVFLEDRKRIKTEDSGQSEPIFLRSGAYSQVMKVLN